MLQILEDFKTIALNPDTLSIALKTGLILISGFVIINLVRIIIVRSIRQRATSQTVMITNKVVFYAGGFIVLFMALKAAGLNLNILLGTAGVAGIAVGFASQTSVSNVISGIFLMSEKAFEVDDVITVGDKTGIVMSIDLLSVKIRTFANQYIRIPNESLIKTDVINITRFPIRRLDIKLKVGFNEDVEEINGMLLELAKHNPFCLDNPAPLFIFNGWGDSAIELFFGVWFEKSDYIKLKNSMMLDIKNSFAARGIEVPYPGIRIVENPASSGPAMLPADGTVNSAVSPAGDLGEDLTSETAKKDGGS